MFQSNSFQSFAFQTTGNATNDNTAGWSYTHPHVDRDNLREKIRREKSELQKLDSVIVENQRRAELAKKAKEAAKQKRALELAIQENQFLEEINRLMQVRALLLQRIKQDEEALFLMMMLRRRRA
jgi:DNA polymerase III delta prime subunit